ncbi:MAG: TonB-dependent receptor [Deltaproteobacteria bacterium]|nr:TonB-dependent receptor [Deltaproteobacteria bacterium]
MLYVLLIGILFSEVPNKNCPDKDSGCNHNKSSIPPKKEELKNLKKKIVHPVLKKYFAPEYPPTEYRNNVESTVLLYLTIGKDGKVISVEIGKSGGINFDKSAITAAKKFEFSPASIQNIPVVVKIPVKIPFKISVKKKKKSEPVKDSAKQNKKNGENENKTEVLRKNQPEKIPEPVKIVDNNKDKSPGKPSKQNPKIKPVEPVKKKLPELKAGKNPVPVKIIDKKEPKLRKKTASAAKKIKQKLLVDDSNDDTVVVTGTLSARKIKDVPVKTEVISSKQITRKGAVNLTTALDMEPGVSVDNGCSICGATSIRLSGLPGRYTLYTIDGMPLYSSLGSTYGLAGIPAASIGKIEIVKGASSVLYGTDAIGGIVNVITKKPSKRITSVEFRLGTYDEYYLSAVSTGFKNDVIINGDWFGILSYASFENTGKVDRDGDGVTEKAWMQRSSAGLAFHYTPIESLELKFRSGILNETRQGGGTSDFLGVITDYDPSTSYGMRSISESIMSRRIENAFTLTYNRNQFAAGLKSAFVYHFQDSDYEGEYYRAVQNLFYFNPFFIMKPSSWYSVTGGGSFRLENLEENLANADYSHKLTGFFLEGSLKNKNSFEFLHGIRFDYHNTYGKVITPRIALKYEIFKDVNIRTSTGTAFRAPTTFYEYSHGVHPGGYTVEMAADNPETSKGVNASVVISRIRNWTFTVEGAYNRVENAIAMESLNDGALLRVFNVDTPLEVVSFEAQIQGKPFSFMKIQAGYGHYNYKDPSNVNQSAPPSQQFTLGVFLKKGPFALNFTSKLLAPVDLRKVYGYAYNPVQGISADQLLDPTIGADTSSPKLSKSPWWGTGNIVLEYNFSKKGTFYFGINNILDYHQSDIEGPLMFPSSTGAAGGAPTPLDVVYIWGPLEGRCFYSGIRLSI